MKIDPHGNNHAGTRQSLLAPFLTSSMQAVPPNYRSREMFIRITQTGLDIVRRRSSLRAALVSVTAAVALCASGATRAEALQQVTFDNSQNAYELTITYDSGLADCLNESPPSGTIILPAYMVTYVEFKDSNAAGHCDGGSKRAGWVLSTGPKNDAFKVHWWHYKNPDWVTQIWVEKEALEIAAMQNIKIEARCVVGAGDTSPVDCLNKDASAEDGLPGATIYIINANKP